MSFFADFHRMSECFCQFAADFHLFVQDFHLYVQSVLGQEIVGLDVSFSPPTERENRPMQTHSILKSDLKKALVPHKKGAGAPPSLGIQDNQDGTATVTGMDAAGATGIDLSGVATLTPPPSSDTPTVFTVSTPTGMTFPYAGVLPGTAKLTITATWNTPGTGPFALDVPVTVSTGPATGLSVDFGTPVVRP